MTLNAPDEVAKYAVPSATRERTTYAVWEITLKCNLACGHCGSRAGDARTDELSSPEALDLVRQLDEIGIKEVSLIGGEAFLRHDWLDIAREINRRGMACTMTTGGYGINPTTAERMADAGIGRVSVSIDGLSKTHDKQRGKLGSFREAFKSIENLRKARIYVGINTQINRLSAPELPRIYEKIRDAGTNAWQLQLTVPMGNAADNSGWLFQPHELLDVFPMIAYLAKRGQDEGVVIQPGNNVGYFGPYDRFLRDRGSNKWGEWAIWTGCDAGIGTLGIEADGKIKGCPSLPSSAYTGGNIRTRSLQDIVYNTSELNINDTKGTPEATDHMWGFCKTCKFASVCRGGCSWTSHVFFDKRGNNPYCHHRALTQAGRGVRERVHLAVAASGLPFDNGRFDLVEEPIDAALPTDDPMQFRASDVQWPAAWLADDPSLATMIQQQRDDAIDIYRPS